MLDTIPQNSALKHWQTVLKPGHIVTFAFPFRETDERPKVRPCLVLDVFDRDGKRFAVLAYGTTAPTNANRGYEVHVTDDLALKFTGLRRPTRFVGARRIIISLDHRGFVCNRMGTPIIGHLVGTAQDQMNGVRSRIQAFADMRKEARERRDLYRRRHAPQQLSLF